MSKHSPQEPETEINDIGPAFFGRIWGSLPGQAPCSPEAPPRFTFVNSATRRHKPLISELLCFCDKIPEFVRVLE